jgi:adenosine/AMP kinase
METEQGRGIMGVIDGFKSKGVEGEADKSARKELLRKIGYKL